FGMATEIFLTPHSTLTLMEDDPATMTCSVKLFQSMVNLTDVESLEIAKYEYESPLVFYHRNGHSK
ncbi:hypothetical protein Bpfe_013510, partial [Biomphalaria pfeifferi]